MPNIANLKSKVGTLQQLLEAPNVQDAAWQLALYDAVERVAEYSTNHIFSPLSEPERGQEQTMVCASSHDHCIVV